ncbi:hypothetical protein [Streptacidiphilus monticola]|uniref:Secreted protein n=1 Tax=Streptacidiphilus monticola TaxID=2161674 RepID=A0ABW1FXH9_9ACTN
MSRKRRFLSGVALVLAGAAAPAPAFAANQVQSPEIAPALGGVSGALPYAVHPLEALRLDPMANSSADPLDNGVAVQPDNGVPEVSSLPVTSPLSNGGGVGSLLGGLGN